MVRKKTIICFLVLIFLAATKLIFNNLSKAINREVAFNRKINREGRQNSKNNRIYNRSNSEKSETVSVYYRLPKDTEYRYEFRFEFNPSTKNDDHRLMLILYGANRACNDMWDFSVGIRTLNAIRHFGYSILAICSPRKTYDINLPIGKNNDVRYIYLTLQKWMNTVYYSRFKRYPLLYIHATSRGSKFAGILCRILPIQAQILYIYPGHRKTMLTPSAYDSDMQTRLIIDSTFANWFYFDFCYNLATKKVENQTLCPFRSDLDYFYPLPPTFFTCLRNDPYHKEEVYKYIISEILRKATHLGGILLNRTGTLPLDILPPVQLNISYMQENFHAWHSKPHAAQLFFEHFTNPKKYRTVNSKRRTCWCSKIDFKYFEQMPHITITWSRKKQDEYSDYIRDIRKFQHAFCEEVCGDLMTTHSMISRNINKTLDWIYEMDQLRYSLYIDDYLNRPLRIWMYDKKLLMKNSMYFSSQEVNWMNIEKKFQMYSPEYYLQDYFQRLNSSKEIHHHHHLQWAINPLLADYFIIPSDLMFFYFLHRPLILNNSEFNKLHIQLNENYFERLLMNICTNFPYWTLAPNADQIGANHILTIPGGRNMGILFNKTQNILRNVIQLAFTGIRQDLLPPNAPPQYVYKGIRVTYRHHYDVIIPQSTPLNMNRSRFEDLDVLLQTKKRLFYFAGTLFHSTSSHSARSQLSLLWRDIQRQQKSNMTTEIQGKKFDTIMIIDGHIEAHEYIKSIQSSVFSLCPEGFLPWSPRLYEAIQIGAIPIVLADNIVLPFERFIDWRSFSAKINVSNIRNITDFIYPINNFEQYTKQKLTSALPYLDAFRWPYSFVSENEHYNHTFQPQDDKNGQAKNVFHYLSLELRCRRLEQWYGLTVDTSTAKSIEAQRLACTNHPTICPCHNEQRSLAYQEYI